MIDRPTLRELKRDVEQLGEDGRTPTRETSIIRVLVMSRKRAERGDCEILGPADVAADGDFVRVDPNG